MIEPSSWFSITITATRTERTEVTGRADGDDAGDGELQATSAIAEAPIHTVVLLTVVPAAPGRSGSRGGGESRRPATTGPGRPGRGAAPATVRRDRSRRPATRCGWWPDRSGRRGAGSRRSRR